MTLRRDFSFLRRMRNGFPGGVMAFEKLVGNLFRFSVTESTVAVVTKAQFSKEVLRL